MLLDSVFFVLRFSRLTEGVHAKPLKTHRNSGCKTPIFVSSDFTPLSPVEQAGAVVSSREYWKRTAKQFSATD